MEFNRYSYDGAWLGNERHRVPGWARAEHLEMNVPQKELWHYAEDAPMASGCRAPGLSRLAALVISAATVLFARSFFGGPK